MADPRFFTCAGPYTLAEIARQSGAELQADDPSLQLTDVAPLDSAEAHHLSFLDNPKYIGQFETSHAGACLVHPKHKDRAPEGMALLLHPDPYRAYALMAQTFYPPTQGDNIASTAIIGDSATIGSQVEIGHGAVIGSNVTIGNHCSIGANTVIEQGVIIGDHCQIGANASVSHAMIGSHVIIHRGACIGQDGFGFAMGAEGHVAVPQLGRVIIEDHVDIGAATCIDRGAGPDTVIGTGCKIDNLVQIAHNVQLGKGTIIASQTGVSGSAVIGKGVIMGGQVGIVGHINIGDGAILAARTAVMSPVEGGNTYGGMPAMPIKDWHRAFVTLKQLAKRKPKDRV